MAGFFGIGGSPAPSFGGGPSYSAVNARIAGMNAPTAVNGPGAYQPQTNSYQAQDMSKTPLPQYDTMREQANQQANQSASQGSDAMARRYASMGMLNSGAYAAEGAVQDQTNAQNKANANLTIGAQEAETRTGLQQTQQQEAYQSGEALAGRNFQGQMANQEQNLQAGEFNTGAQQQFQQNQVGDYLGSAGLEESQAESQYNSAMNAYTAKNTGGLLGSGGFAGTGLTGGLLGSGGFAGTGLF